MRPELVTRPRLTDRLTAGLRQNGGFGSKLTLISAPTGFGKTTLVSEWVRSMSGSNEVASIAWLSLHKNDSDLARFLLYLQAAPGCAAAMGGTFGDQAAAMLLLPQTPSADVILTALINGLHSASPWWLLLDLSN